MFVGKLIASKGVELLLAAWPLVLAREPRARLLIVGFGAFRDGLESLAAALAAGDLDCGAGVARRGGRRSCRSWPPTSADADASLRLDRVAFAGRLDARRGRRPAARRGGGDDDQHVPGGVRDGRRRGRGVRRAAGRRQPLRDGGGRAHAARRGAGRGARVALVRGGRRGGGASSRTRCRAGSARRTRCARRRARRSSRSTRARYSWDGVARGVIAAAQGELEDLAEPA